ncbi:golgin subfamily A member 1-like isoform X2 [Centruroides vittatus]|uniref:golgin subfamily A member 1-like isoform X2 n=1 Tax=Centruroides vittatus TaxID=120091 RepID=UPI003510749A
MFAKLRKKIEEENNTELARTLSPTVTPPISRSGSESSPKSSTTQLFSEKEKFLKNVNVAASRNGPRRSLGGSVGDLIGVSMRKDEFVSDGNESDRSDEKLQSKRKTQTHFLQAKIVDLNQKIKEQNEHFQSQHEQQQLVLSKKEQEWKDTFIKLEKEKGDLKAQLQEVQKRMEKIIENQENKDELESFQSQEMSKIKHLLLKSQQELRGCEETLKSKEEELENSNKKISQLEISNKTLEQQLEKAKADLGQIYNLQAEKGQLEDEVDHLKQESLKTSSIFEEKDNYISHLEDRLAMLQQRLNDSTLTGDEKEKALINERISMEKKLEESRQQLIEIKTTWSEKITSLENQIYNLNKKMADDSQECSRLEEELEETRLSLSRKEEELWKMEDTVQKQNRDLTKMKSDNEKNIEKIEESHKTIQEDLEAKIRHLEEELSRTKEEWEKGSKEAKNRINDLVAAQTEHVEKELEVEKYLTQLEDENHKLKSSLSEREKECLQLTEIANGYKQEINDHQIKFSQLEKDYNSVSYAKEQLNSHLQEKEIELQNVSQEKDNLLVRNAELSHQLEITKQELKEEQNLREREKESYEEKIHQLNSELELHEMKIKDLEIKLAENVENSDNINKLKSVLTELENQLMDKNKMIKLQQQRLSDMKKTLQRELKIQSGTDGILPIDSAEIPMIQPTDSRISSGWSQSIPNKKNYHVDGDDDINFQYLKHVIFKFMTSEDYEAQHLIKAISVLLHFTSEEEKLIKQMMEWKMSWFRARPRVKGHPLIS